MVGKGRVGGRGRVGYLSDKWLQRYRLLENPTQIYYFSKMF